MLLDSVSDVMCAKRKYHLGRTWPKEILNGIHINYLTQILKHDNIMCFRPNGMEHASILSQNKHSFFKKKSSSRVNNQTKFYDESGKNILLNIMHQTISSSCKNNVMLAQQ